MNWKNAFFVSLAAFVVSTGWAIKLYNEKPAQQVAQSENEKNGGIHQMPYAECLGSYPTIPFAEGKCRADAYSGFANSVLWDASYENIYPMGTIACLAPNPLQLTYDNGTATYFHIDRPCELAALLKLASDSDTLQIYAALAL